MGELTRLPLEDESVAGAVCALALSHLPEIAGAIAELGRVLAPGGRLVISDPHPLASGVLGWRAVYTDEGGERRMIPEYPHLHAEYVDAFAAAGLVVRRLIEPGGQRAAHYATRTTRGSTCTQSSSTRTATAGSSSTATPGANTRPTA